MTDRESLRAEVEALPVTFAAEPFRAAVLALLSEPDTGAGLDVERLAEAITLHRMSFRGGPNDPYASAFGGHYCMGDCAQGLAAEYARLSESGS